MRVVAAGDCCVDVYENLGRHYPTGNCVDFAVNLRRYGHEVAVISVAGNDAYGDEMLAMLNARGLDASHMKRAAGKTAVALMEMNGNDRVHAHFDEGVLAGFDLSEEDLHFIQGFDLIHGVMWGKINHHLPRLFSYGKPIVYDFSTFHDAEGIDEAAKYIHTGFFSYWEEDAAIRALLRDMVAKGMETAVGMLGEHGAIAFDGTAFYRQEAVKVDVVNTVGAGDSFIAGYAHGMLEGYDIPGCLAAGAEMAARIIQVFDPYLSL